MSHGEEESHSIGNGCYPSQLTIRYYAGVCPDRRRFVASVGMMNLEGELLEDPADFVRQSLQTDIRPEPIPQETFDVLKWNRKVTQINYQLYVWFFD